MKTDPISAAGAYQMALKRIRSATTLQEARAIAQEGLGITFDTPEPNTISVSSGFGRTTQQPFVTIALASPIETANPAVQIVSDQARAIALQILEAADAAESDGFLVTWMTSSSAGSLSDHQAAALLADFRAWRDRRRAP